MLKGRVKLFVGQRDGEHCSVSPAGEKSVAARRIRSVASPIKKLSFSRQLVSQAIVILIRMGNDNRKQRFIDLFKTRHLRKFHLARITCFERQTYVQNDLLTLRFDLDASPQSRAISMNTDSHI